MDSTGSPKLVIDLVPRSGSNCLDLGVRWVGRNLEAVLRMTLPFAIAGAVLAWGLVRFVELDARILLPMTGLATWPLGVIIGRWVAGEAFDRRPGGRRFVRDLVYSLLYRVLEWSGPVLMLLQLHRDGQAMLFIVGLVMFLLVTPRPGLVGSFTAEDGVLDRRGTGRASQRTRELVKRDRGEVFIRWCWWAIFWTVLVAVVIAGIETFSYSMFQWSPLFGRDRDELVGYFWTDGPGPMLGYLVYSPMAVATFVFVATLVYPIIRAAWTFHYVNMRIRRDLWDLQQRCHAEARRLGETS